MASTYRPTAADRIAKRLGWHSALDWVDTTLWVDTKLCCQLSCSSSIVSICYDPCLWDSPFINNSVGLILVLELLHGIRDCTSRNIEQFGGLNNWKWSRPCLNNMLYSEKKSRILTVIEKKNNNNDQRVKVLRMSLTRLIRSHPWYLLVQSPN